VKCPKCQADNKVEAKFCGNCGAKLSLICSQCGSENTPGNNFCNECGHRLDTPSKEAPKPLSSGEKIEKIQKYLPKGIAEKILAQKDRIEGERKQVTVMFCDMEGFTGLSDKIDPEEVYSIMDQVYEILIHKVHDYEGTVNEMTGDGILALFGAPIALEDAPQRAIRSALAIHREISRFNDKMKMEKPGLPKLNMRVGIHTGPVVVGTLGNDLRVEFKAVGDTVNLASRMESMAEPGTTFVTEDTFMLAEGYFRFEGLGERQIKGKAAPVKVFRVITPSARRTRFDVSAERGLTPFVGRERELELLLDGFERAKARRGQVFSIMSEAGVGKSRLLYEFRKAVANEDATFLEGKCLSFSRGVAYHPVTDILKANFDVLESDGDAEIKEKVKRGLKILGLDEASTLPYFLELLSVKDSGIDKIMMSPEGKKDQITEALKRIVLKGSEIRPLITAFEDLHWVDKSSEEVIKYVLESIPGARVLLIFTYRPEFVHTWGAKSYHNQMTLSRLSNRESVAMVSHLLDTQDVDRNLEELILEKTEGVPFFIEEFLRSLKELKIIEKENKKYRLTKHVQDVAIPSTIQDVIMARVDSLPEGAKELLQTGSVIEREFSYELIKRVTNISQEELLSHLSVLKDSELLYERGIYPQSTYIFKHALTQQVAYESILTKKKKQLHEKIGNAIEKLFKDNIDKYYGVLGEHYITSENYQKGAEFSHLAAKKAIKTGLNKEGIEFGKKRIFCLEKLPKTEAIQKKFIDARTVLASYCLNINYHVEAKEAVAPIVDLAVELNYERMLPGIYTAIALYHIWVEENVSEGIKYLNESLKIAEKTDNYLSQQISSFFLGMTLSWNCEFEEALHHFKRSLDLSLMAKSSMVTFFTKNNMSTVNLAFQNKIDLAHQTCKEVLKMAKESDDTYLEGAAYSGYGTCCYLKGLFTEAENNLLRAVALCEKTSHFSWGGWVTIWLGLRSFDVGDYEKAQNHHAEGISFFERCQILPSFIRLHKVAIARAKVLNNERDVNLTDMFACYEKNKIKVLVGWVARLIAEIRLNIDDQSITDAEDWIIKAIEADERSGMMWNLAQDYTLYSEFYKRKGNLIKAKEKLDNAIEIFKECGADGWVEKYEKELSALSRQ
jgi:class 3 adenylate cyclase/tetratricopeptide (TPR) repeat protein